MIKIKYLDECLAKMVKVKKGDLIDLRVSWVEVNGRRYDSIAMEVESSTVKRYMTAVISSSSFLRFI